MAWENWLDLATVFISVVALAFAWVSWRMSHHADRRIVEIEESRDAEAKRQGARASLTATWETFRAPVGSMAFAAGSTRIAGGRLTIVNKGPASARAVRVLIDDVDVTNMAAAPFDGGGRIERLDPDAVAKVSFDYQAMVERTFRRVRVEWEDGSGEPGLFESEL